METAVQNLVSAIEALPVHAANDDVAAVFAAYDLLTAWLSAASTDVDPAADGATTLAHGYEAKVGARTVKRPRW